MKRRFLAFFLIFALTLSPWAMASQALGWELFQTDTLLGPGVTLTTQTFWGDSVKDYRAEQYVTYTPGQGSLPVVCYGATVPSTATVTAMAKTLESWGSRVLAGTNGDYFVMASGVPLGMVVTDGVLRSSSSYHYAVGFLPDGSAFVGKPELAVTADFHGFQLAVSGGYNKTREAQGGYTLFSPDFGATTRGSGTGVNVVLRPVTVPEDYIAPVKPDPFLEPEPERPVDQSGMSDGADTLAQPDEGVASGVVDTGETAEPGAWELWQQAKTAWEQAMAQWEWDLAWSVSGFETLPAQLAIGGEVTCVVEDVSEYNGPIAIPEGRLVLSVDKRSSDFLVDELAGLALGEQVKLSVSAADSRWGQAVSALGAYEWILRGGQVPNGLENTAAPRTALGVKPDGQVVLYTIDGRRSGHSMGATVTQVARRLLELGCDQAVLFDGGGSTTFGATGALDESFSLQNRPSEGSQRAVTNALFFVSPLKATGALGSLYIQPHSALMLSGASLSLSCRGIDTGYYPMGEEPIGGVTYTAQGPGSVAGNVFTAGAETGVATVTATAPGGAKGTAVMNVVDTPHTITVADAATGKAVSGVNLDPGQSVSLSASATWYKLALLADSSCFTWSVSPEVGTVDETGTLTAGPRAAAGSLTVSAGDKSVDIPVTVGGHVNTLEAWESGERVPAMDPEGPVQAELTREQVRYGKAALKVSYPSWEEGRLPLDLPIAAGESYLSLWMYADTPPLAMKAELALEDGSLTTVSLTLPEDGQGTWGRLWAAIPENTVRLTALLMTCDQQGADPGSDDMAVPGGVYIDQLYLDHFTTANSHVVDSTAPTAKFTWADGVLTAKLGDNTDKTFDPSNLTLTLDGWKLGFVLEGNTLTAPLELADGLAHRVSLEVQDASGNLGRASLDIPGSAQAANPFTDIEGHWAQANIVYLAQQGVTNGRQSGDGAFIFDPQVNITRGEFATMLGRWLRADLAAYEGAGLPFVDAGEVPSWALPAVGYLYDAGIMTGSLEGDGLYAKADQPITRAQAMAMLGRVQARGYAPQAETFADDADIPTWAREHVYTLAGQGVVSGYAGYVRPQDPITRSEVAKLLTTLW